MNTESATTPETSPETEPETSELEGKLPIIAEGQNEYTVICAEDADPQVAEAVDILCLAVKDVLGVELARATDSAAATDKEILIGATNRPDSAAVLEGYTGDGYAMAVKGERNWSSMPPHPMPL